MSKRIRRAAHERRLHPGRLGAATLVAVCLAISWTSSSRTHAAQPPRSSQSTPPVDAAAVFASYCRSCHTETMKARGAVPVAFDSLDANNVAAAPAAWEQIVRKMRGGLMPPSKSPHPDRATRDAFLAKVEGDLD